MRITNFLIVFVMFFIQQHQVEALFLNVKDYGAKGDGITIDTKSLQAAIEECSLKGGTVYFPPGKYLAGTLILKSNVDIYLANGAIILGSPNIKDYKDIEIEFKSYNNIFLRHSLLFAQKAENISIRGEGIIDGQGGYFEVNTKIKPDRYKNRPFIIRFVECKNVRIENITMMNSAMWMQHYLACEDLIIHGIKVINHANQNNDMIDIDGCKNVVISDCIGDSDDDGITLKSTSNRITENVVISNCVVSSHCNAIKLGTESSGGFRNITISNIVVKPSKDTTPIFGYRYGISGITLTIVDGGILDGVSVSNLVIEGTQVPIFLRLGNRARKYYEEQPKPPVGIFRDVRICNVIAREVQSPIGCSFTGIPNHYLQNIYLENISIEFPGGIRNDSINKIIPELEDHYPESTMWGILPSYGFFIRHVKNISLNNIEMKLKNFDARPAIVCDDVKQISLLNLRTDSIHNAEYVFSFFNVIDGIIQSSLILSNAKTFLLVNGKQSRNIVVRNNTLTNVKELIENKVKIEILEEGNIIK